MEFAPRNEELIMDIDLPTQSMLLKHSSLISEDDASSLSGKSEDSKQIQYTDRFMDKIVDESYFNDNSSQAQRFPLHIHKVLDDETVQDVITWLPHGRAFVILDREAFIELVMPKYFSSCRFTSFKRQLSWYRFSRVNIGPDKGAYYHECFLRGRPDLTANIQRRKALPSSHEDISDSLPPPNFYNLPFCIDLLDQDILFLSGRFRQKQKAPLNRANSETSVSPTAMLELKECELTGSPRSPMDLLFSTVQQGTQSLAMNF